ncbi:MarR family winged helix-turn-helix transcriptional regulator [Zhihengliuella halotolerans]|uniref:DNA-binding MarR family transcriptional regulator n=1 Tax=Zhihengliuella halotolerans TaxID=370736 RepID=A0A4Q8AE24_9MICC|nr:MarR family transcriptional regulator [Zhihengliuella halotolerans]RZU62468.1 DNA-binding MarR family transcriptional regulator [Zhihengliuella halotolerans]
MTEPRWLTPDEREAWLALWAVMLKLPSTLDSELHKQARLTIFDYNVLAMLSEEDDRTLTMSQLAGKTNASLSRLSHVVKKLESRGWVERRRSPVDARVTTATLTDEGIDSVEALAPEHVESVRRLMFDQLEDRDIADLTRIGQKIVRGLDSDHWIFHDRGD